MKTVLKFDTEDTTHEIGDLEKNGFLLDEEDEYFYKGLDNFVDLNEGDRIDVMGYYHIIRFKYYHVEDENMVYILSIE